MSVVGVWGIFFHGTDEILVHENLSDMEDVRCFVGSILECGAVLLSEDMDVGSATGVVTREDSQPLSDTVIIGLLDAPEVGCVLHR